MVGLDPDSLKKDPITILILFLKMMSQFLLRFFLINWVENLVNLFNSLFENFLC